MNFKEYLNEGNLNYNNKFQGNILFSFKSNNIKKFEETITTAYIGTINQKSHCFIDFSVQLESPKELELLIGLCKKFSSHGIITTDKTKTLILEY